MPNTYITIVLRMISSFTYSGIFAINFGNFSEKLL